MYPDYPDPLPTFRYLGGEHGVRQLESALAAPQQTFGGVYLHRTVFDKAAALFRSIVINHPLEDGNKRLALTSAFVFLGWNGYLFFRPQDEAVGFAIRVAVNTPPIRIPETAKWFKHGSMKLPRHAAVMQQDALKALLRNLGSTSQDRSRIIGVLITPRQGS